MRWTILVKKNSEIFGPIYKLPTSLWRLIISWQLFSLQIKGAIGSFVDVLLSLCILLNKAASPPKFWEKKTICPEIGHYNWPRSGPWWRDSFAFCTQFHRRRQSAPPALVVVLVVVTTYWYVAITCQLLWMSPFVQRRHCTEQCHFKSSKLIQWHALQGGILHC